MIALQWDALSRLILHPMATVSQLRQQAKARKIKGYSKMTKAQLMSALGVSSDPRRDMRQQEAARAKGTAKQHGIAQSFAADRLAEKLAQSSPFRHSDSPAGDIKDQLLSRVKSDLRKAQRKNPNLTQDQKRAIAVKALKEESTAIRKKHAQWNAEAAAMKAEKGKDSKRSTTSAKPKAEPKASNKDVNRQLNQLRRDSLAGKISPSEAMAQAAKLGGKKAEERFRDSLSKTKAETVLRAQGKTDAADKLKPRRGNSYSQELGSAAKLREGKPIKDQAEFDKHAEKAFDAIDKHQKRDGLVPIIAVRRALGDRVGREEFDKMLRTFQDKGYTLVGGEAADSGHYSTTDIIKEGVKNSLGAPRFYLKKDKK